MKRSSRRTLLLVLFVTALALIIAGFAGLDRWFYENVSLKTNVDTNLSKSFYHQTRWLWDAARWIGHPLGVGLGLIAVTLLHPRSWRIAVLLGIAILITDTAGYLAKGTISRIRPNQSQSQLAFAAPFSGFTSSDDVKTSFPSGEATAAFALSAGLAIAAPGYGWLFYLLAGLCAAARLVAGAHYLSDVTAGVLLGVWLTNGCYAALQNAAIFARLNGAQGTETPVR